MLLQKFSSILFHCRKSLLVSSLHNRSLSSTTSTSSSLLQFPEPRVRFAPSPTGELHLGGLRTALFNYLFAASKSGSFLLRIEDTDQARTVDGAKERLINLLNWAGIAPVNANNPAIQSHNLPRYKEIADQLVESGWAYRCFCSPERLDKLRKTRAKSGSQSIYDRHCLGLGRPEIEKSLSQGQDHTIRLKVPRGRLITVEDLVAGTVKFDSTIIDDQILLKSDGYPTYHLANVVDDHDSGITHVIRGEEWLPSTPKHLLLYEALDWSPPNFAHLPLLLKGGGGKGKLSKRDAAASINTDRYTPEAIVNFIALLGWSPVGEEEVFSLDQLIEQFSLDRVQKSGAVVDPKKLEWLASQHLRSLAASPEGLQRLIDDLLPRLEPSWSQDRAYAGLVISTIKERVSSISDIPKLCSYFWQDPVVNLNSSKRSVIEASALKFESIQEKDWNESSIATELKVIQSELNISAMKDIMLPLRWAMTGTKIGAGVARTAETLGKSTTLSRLSQVQFEE